MKKKKSRRFLWHQALCIKAERVFPDKMPCEMTNYSQKVNCSLHTKQSASIQFAVGSLLILSMSKSFRALPFRITSAPSPYECAQSSFCNLQFALKVLQQPAARAENPTDDGANTKFAIWPIWIGKVPCPPPSRRSCSD